MIFMYLISAMYSGEIKSDITIDIEETKLIHRHTGEWDWGGQQPSPQFFENHIYSGKITLSFGQRRSSD